ncbi:caspase family protein [Streptomyces narbonensis]
MSVLPDPGATRAVLIGTSHYDHLESLPAVSNNLTALAEALTGPASWTLPQEHCTYLSNPTTAEMTMAAVRAAAEQARDTVLIYFAGHGLVDPEGDLYLAMPQSKQQRVETGLPYRWIRQALLTTGPIDVSLSSTAATAVWPSGRWAAHQIWPIRRPWRGICWPLLQKHAKHSPRRTRPSPRSPASSSTRFRRASPMGLS